MNSKSDSNGEGLGAVTGSAFWLLFQHMSKDYGLTLLESEMEEICHVVDSMRDEWETVKLKRQCRKCWGTGQTEIQSGPYYRECVACGGTGQND